MPGTANPSTIAAREGFANAVTHAYPEGGAGPVSLRVERSERDVVVVVAGRGTGIASSTRASGGDLGLGLRS